MIRVNIHQAKTQLSKYIELVEAGETIVFCRRNVPVAEIHPTVRERVQTRPLGLAKQQYGEWKLSEAFFEPLPGELLDAFEGES